MVKKYFGQQCQDDILNQKFRELHHKLVNDIISFCKDNNIEAEEVILRADGLKGSIPYKEINKVLSDSDLVVHVESFDKSDIKNIRFSFS